MSGNGTASAVGRGADNISASGTRQSQTCADDKCTRQQARAIAHGAAVAVVEGADFAAGYGARKIQTRSGGEYT